MFVPLLATHERVHMADAATTLERPLQVELSRDLEEYMHGTNRLRLLGSVGIAGAFEQERIGIYHEVRTDFISSVEENLTSDREFNEQLKFEPLRTYPIVDGFVVDGTGVRLIDIVAEGLESSRKAAIQDPRMELQAQCDEGHVEVQQVIDSLEVGEMYAVLSLDLKDAIDQDKEFWEDEMGYRKGMAVLQVFYKQSADEAVFGTYSIKQSDRDKLRELLRGHGFDFPDDLPDTQWTKYGLRQKASYEEATNFGNVIQSEYRQKVGNTKPELSVTQLLEANQQLMQGYFDDYILPLARSRYTGKTEPVLADFARALLSRPDSLESHERQQLMRIANSNTFRVSDARLMESLIRYSVVEDLRKQLPHYLASTEGTELQIQHQEQVQSQDIIILPNFNFDQMYRSHRSLVENFASGRDAGREYGGCSGGSKRADGFSVEGEDIRKSLTELANEAMERSNTELDKENEACEYSGTFCYCCPYKEDGSPAAKEVEVTIVRDSKGVAVCQRGGCGATMKGDTVTDKGGIYRKAMQRLKNVPESQAA